MRFKVWFSMFGRVTNSYRRFPFNHQLKIVYDIAETIGVIERQLLNHYFMLHPTSKSLDLSIEENTKLLRNQSSQEYIIRALPYIIYGSGIVLSLLSSCIKTTVTPWLWRINIPITILSHETFCRIVKTMIRHKSSLYRLWSYFL